MPRIEWREFEPYNPLDEDELAASVQRALEARPLEPVPPDHFRGAGLYAFYYFGDFAPYQPIVEDEVPIYIGRAAAGAGRHGSGGRSVARLLDRIRQHSRSIEAAENLDLADFCVRFLVTADAWIVLGEHSLLSAYHPVLWNTVVDGFGNKAQGKGRDEQVRSKWDTLHPGREAPKVLRPNPLGFDGVANLVNDALAARARGEHVEVDVQDED